MPPTTETYLDSIITDTATLAATITDETLDTDVPTCPGWTVRDLAHHLGEVQRWARLAAVTGAPPQDDAIDPPPAPGPDEAPALRDWLRAGAQALVDAMRDGDPTAATWHPFPVPKVLGVWPRRQAHEVAVHRWDAQRAVGEPGDAFPLAADFVAEYFEVIVPRVVDRDGRTPPVGCLRVRLTDAGTASSVDTTDGTVRFDPGDDGTRDLPEITGSADDVILALWRRQPLPDGPTSPLAAQWLGFGGN